MVITVPHLTTVVEQMAVAQDQLYKVALAVAAITAAEAAAEATTEVAAEVVLAVLEMVEKVDLTTLVVIADLQQLHQRHQIQTETQVRIQLAMADMALLEMMADYG